MTKSHLYDIPADFSTGKVELSPHGFERMQERFPEQSRNKNSAVAHVRSLLKNSKYIGLVADKNMVDSHMFVFGKIAIHLEQETYTVLTVYPIEKEKSVLAVQKQVVALYQKEFRKTNREEQAFKKKLNLLVAENEMAIATLNLRKLRSRSETVKKQCTEEIGELKSQMWKAHGDLKNMQMRKRDLAYAIATENY